MGKPGRRGGSVSSAATSVLGAGAGDGSTDGLVKSGTPILGMGKNLLKCWYRPGKLTCPLFKGLFQ